MITSLTWLLDTVAPVAEGAPTPDGGLASMIPTIGMMVAMVAVFYFMLIRPQRKKDKAVKDMLAAMKVGDNVTTIGGIHGTIKSIKDDVITIVSAQKSELVMARWGIRSIEDAPLENDAEPSV